MHGKSGHTNLNPVAFMDERKFFGQKPELNSIAKSTLPTISKFSGQKQAKQRICFLNVSFSLFLLDQ